MLIITYRHVSVVLFILYYMVRNTLFKGGFSFFSQEGWKNFWRGGQILGGVQVICNMPFLMLREGHEMANQSALGGWSEILMGFNTF